jgi:hypothetical protein
MRVPVDSQDLRAASGEFKAVEPGVAANVENGPPAQIGRQVRRKLLPLPVREITKMMMRKGLDGGREVNIMETRDLGA